MTRQTFQKTTIAFCIVMALTYLLAYAIWETKDDSYWICRATNGPLLDQGCGLKPDGPLYALLFMMIPVGVAISFFIVVLILKLAGKTKK
jgi:hypothetical protein